MSSLWTPDGERPVPPRPTTSEPSDEAEVEGEVEVEVEAEPVPDFDNLSPEEQAELQEMAEQMAQVREELARTPAAVVIANHLMGFYELAAIHLSQTPPNFPEAAVAIDAMVAVVEKLEGRLGENEPVLRDALNQLRMAFVSLKNQS